MKYKEYRAEVDRVHALEPRWRFGQTAFNVLYDMYPDLADEIRGSNIDPFYSCDGKKIETFFERVEVELNKEI